MLLNVRRLAALDLYGTTGSARRRRSAARELRQAGARQLWILIPLAVVIAALAQAWSRRRQRHGHRDDSPAEQVVDK
jgi:hypothetical protein